MLLVLTWIWLGKYTAPLSVFARWAKPYKKYLYCQTLIQTLYMFIVDMTDKNSPKSITIIHWWCPYCNFWTLLILKCLDLKSWNTWKLKKIYHHNTILNSFPTLILQSYVKFSEKGRYLNHFMVDVVLNH